jgi:hypothetical protein
MKQTNPAPKFTLIVNNNPELSAPRRGHLRLVTPETQWLEEMNMITPAGKAALATAKEMVANGYNDYLTVNFE